jgi:hypothetical protein
MRLLNLRRIAMAAVVTAAATAAVVAFGSSASADGGTLYGMSDDEAHVCTVLGTDSAGHKGVLCVDLFATELLDVNIPTGDVSTSASAELICEDSQAHITECADAYAQGVELANAQKGVVDSVGYWECHSPNCSTDRNYVHTDAQTVYFNDSGLTRNYWGLVVAAGIELPGSGKWVYLGSSNGNDGGELSTGHWWIVG